MKNEEFDDYLIELLTWEQDRDPLRKQWDDFWSRWELTPPNDVDNPFISRFQAPYPFSHVETILPRIVGVDPTITYTAIDHEEDDPPAQMLSAVVGWQMHQMGFEHEIRAFIRQGLMLGYSVAKVGWVREVREETMEVLREAFDEDILQAYDTWEDEKIEIVTKNQGFMETVDIYDFLWPLNAVSIAKAPAVWQRCWVTLDDLEQNAKASNYTNLDKIPLGATGKRQQDLEHRYADQGLNPSTVMMSSGNGKSEIELWERWSDDRLVVIANRDQVIRDEINPFQHGQKPFIDFAPVERPFSMQGVGIIKMIWDMNEDLSALKRQRRDAVTFLINPMWKGTEGIDEDDVIIVPGGLLKVPDTDDIEPMTSPQIDIGASFQEEAQAKDDMQIVSGAYDYFSGLSPDGNQTATGVSTITSEANKRIAEMIKVFSERSMKRFGDQMASLCVQYLDEEVAVPIWQYPEAQQAWETLRRTAAPRIVRVGQADISTAGRVLPIPEVGQDKQLNDVQKRSDATQAIQAIAPLLASPQPVVNPHELTDWILKQFGVSKYDRAKILDTSQQPQMPNVQPSSDGGSNAPTGAVVGAPGSAGGVGGSGLSQQ